MADAELSEIEAAMLRPFVWGQSDCCLAVADVLVAAGYPDFAADWRGRYGTQAEAELLMRGPVDQFLPLHLERLHWPRLACPCSALDFDVGLRRKSAFVRSGGHWWAKTEKGLLRASSVTRAWRPPQ